MPSATITTKRAADEAGVPRQTICRWIREERFAATRRVPHYGAWRIDPESFRSYLASDEAITVAA